MTPDGFKFAFRPAATCPPCAKGQHGDCEGRCRVPHSRAVARCECSMVGHAPLIPVDTS